MHVAYQRFWLPKAGNSADEYEDAFCPDQDFDSIGAEGDFRAAVADGATETSFASLWADLLVRGYCAGVLSDDRHVAITDLRAHWQQQVAVIPLPWYAEEKARSGAYASLLGITIRTGDRDSTHGSWEAVAIGDSCLFQIRQNALLTAHPLTASDQFNSRPILLSSIAPPDASEPEWQLYCGDWQVDDAFYLMSDALACWFLNECEQGREPWVVLRDLETDDALRPFPDLITQLRGCRSLRNDDVTLCRIDVLMY